MAMAGDTCQVVGRLGTLTGEGTSQLDYQTVSSVGVWVILRGNALQLAAAAVAVVGSLHIHDLVVVIDLDRTVLMTGLMGAAMETGSTWVTEKEGTRIVIVTAMTGFLLEVIGFWTGSLKLGMAEIGLLEGMEAQGVVSIDMEAEGPPVTKEEVIGTNLVLMTAREGEVILLMTVTKAMVAFCYPVR